MMMMVSRQQWDQAAVLLIIRIVALKFQKLESEETIGLQKHKTHTHTHTQYNKFITEDV
jgi:hypothetical protein